MTLDERIKKILKQHYGNPIGGKVTHWYINDQATQDLLKVFDEELTEAQNKYGLKSGYWKAIKDMKQNRI